MLAIYLARLTEEPQVYRTLSHSRKTRLIPGPRYGQQGTEVPAGYLSEVIHLMYIVVFIHYHPFYTIDRGRTND